MVTLNRLKATLSCSSLCFHVIAAAVTSLMILAFLPICITMEPRPSPVGVEERTLLNQRKVFIAANYYNNEEILPFHLEQILRLIALIRDAGGGDVFVSVYENASKDSSPRILETFRQTLRQHKVEHRILTERTPSWRETGGGDIGARIKFMAQIRNRVLEPLSGRDMDDVIFFNDVLFDAEDALRLILTENLSYDVVCAMDYNRVTFYDSWVSRDINGFAFAGFYPYVADEQSIQLLKQNQPFPVASCWNGVVVIKAAALANVKFRKWITNEPRSVLIPEHYVYGPKCPVSECALLFKDLVQNGYSRFFVNPAVHVTYKHSDWVRHWVFGGLLNLMSAIFLEIEHYPRFPVADRIPSCDVERLTRYRIWPFVIVVGVAVAGAVALMLYLIPWKRWQTKIRHKGDPKYLV